MSSGEETKEEKVSTKTPQLTQERNQSQEQQKPQTPAPASSEALIYCGPNLPGGRLNRFTVYRGGMPKHLSKVMEDCSAVGRLFVPVSELQSTLAAINEPGTPQHIWFNEVLQYIQGGGQA